MRTWWRRLQRRRNLKRSRMMSMADTTEQLLAKNPSRSHNRTPSKSSRVGSPCIRSVKAQESRRTRKHLRWACQSPGEACRTLRSSFAKVQANSKTLKKAIQKEKPKAPSSWQKVSSQNNVKMRTQLSIQRLQTKRGKNLLSVCLRWI